MCISTVCVCVSLHNVYFERSNERKEKEREEGGGGGGKKETQERKKKLVIIWKWCRKRKPAYRNAGVLPTVQARSPTRPLKCQ